MRPTQAVARFVGRFTHVAEQVVEVAAVFIFEMVKAVLQPIGQVLRSRDQDPQGAAVRLGTVAEGHSLGVEHDLPRVGPQAVDAVKIRRPTGEVTGQVAGLDAQLPGVLVRPVGVLLDVFKVGVRLGGRSEQAAEDDGSFEWESLDSEIAGRCLSA